MESRLCFSNLQIEISDDLNNVYASLQNGPRPEVASDVIFELNGLDDLLCDHCFKVPLLVKIPE